MENTDSKEGYEYYICEILNNIAYKKLEKYVIIPALWIKCPIFSKDKMIIKYPKETTSEIRKNVIKKEMYHNDWPEHLAVQRYGTDIYEDARNYLKILETVNIQNCTSDGRNIVKTICIKESDAPLTEMDSQNQQQTDQINPENANRYATRQKKAQSTLNENASETKPKPVESQEQSGDVIRVDENTNEIVEEQLLLLGIDPQKLSKQEFTSVAQELKNMLDHATKCAEHHSNLHKIFENKCSLLKNMLGLLEFCNNIEDSVPASEQVIDQGGKQQNECNIDLNMSEKNDDNSATDTGNSTEKQKKTMKRKLSAKNSIPDTIVDLEDMERSDELNENIPMEVHATRVEDFVLPPEYDENNPRWSLRYQTTSPDLMELKRGSQIYVNKNKLINALHSSRDSSSLIRMLLMEVFSDNALKTCSMYGVQANAFPEKSKRPALNQDGLNCIFDRVEKHECHIGGKYDKAVIVNTIRCQLRKMRKS